MGRRKQGFTDTSRRYEEPVTISRPGDRGETETTHPAFAQIGASRVSGQITLLDSDFEHGAYMVVRIAPTTMIRNLSNDWFFGGRQPYIEVALSEAQWATFVSAPNVGEGVPCTVQRMNGEAIPQIPKPINRTEQFRDEIKKDIADTLEAADELLALIETLGLPKGKAAALAAKAEVVKRKLTSSLPFVADQFDEHMEVQVEKAKAEVHGYMTGVITRAGLTALGGGEIVAPLLLEGARDE